MRVRLKPYDPAKGHKLRSLCLSWLNGKIYRVEHPWYEEPDHIAAELAKVNQDGSVTEEPIPGLPRAFDIMTTEQVAKLAEADLRARIGAPGAEQVFIAADRNKSKATPVQAPTPTDESAESPESAATDEPAATESPAAAKGAERVGGKKKGG